MLTHENIKRLREQLGLTQEELAHKTGYKDRSSIAKIESGRVDLSATKIAAFAAALGTTPAQLMGLNGTVPDRAPHPALNPFPATRRVPRLGVIACGEPILAAENHEAYDDVPEFVHCDFTLVCKGDSMINARILDGDTVCIRQQSTVENGEIAAVLIDDEATLKRVYLKPDRITLMAENSAYEPIIYSGEEMNQCRILGKAVYFISRLDR